MGGAACAIGACAIGACGIGAGWLTNGGGGVACGMRDGNAGVAIGEGIGSGAFATAALPYAVYGVVAEDVELLPQLDPCGEPHGLAGGGGCLAAEPQLGPAAGTSETGENVAGRDEIARGFVNGMTFADTR